MTINIPTINISPTTANGYLETIAIVCGAVAAESSLPPKVRAIAGSIASIALGIRIRIGHAQKDAGQQEALVPGSATPQIVPSHEIPDSAAAIPVKTTSTATVENVGNNIPLTIAAFPGLGSSQTEVKGVGIVDTRTFPSTDKK